jgi:hypothetical protein
MAEHSRKVTQSKSQPNSDQIPIVMDRADRMDETRIFQTSTSCYRLDLFVMQE